MQTASRPLPKEERTGRCAQHIVRQHGRVLPRHVPNVPQHRVPFLSSPISQDRKSPRSARTASQLTITPLFVPAARSLEWSADSWGCRALGGPPRRARRTQRPKLRPRQGYRPGSPAWTGAVSYQSVAVRRAPLMLQVQKQVQQVVQQVMVQPLLGPLAPR